MIESPLISIIIATKNSEGTLQACLASIFKQEYTNVEVIVIDGASEDRTTEILRLNADKIAFYSSEPDRGIYDAMNKGVARSKGDWILFLGSDDQLLPGFSNLVSELKLPNSIYYGNVIYKGIKCSGFMSAYKMVKTGMSHQAMLYSSSIFKTHKYNLDYKISADSVLNMECWKDKSIKWVYKDYVIAIYNHTGISATNFDTLLKKNMSKLVLENFGLWIWLRYHFRLFKNVYKGK